MILTSVPDLASNQFFLVQPVTLMVVADEPPQGDAKRRAVVRAGPFGFVHTEGSRPVLFACTTEPGKTVPTNMTVVPVDRPAAVPVQQQDPIVVPENPEPIGVGYVEESDTEVEVLEPVEPLRHKAPTHTQLKLHDCPRPAIRFGDPVARRGYYPPAVGTRDMKPYMVNDASLGYTVLVRHNAPDWLHNLVADMRIRVSRSNTAENRAALEWRKRAAAEFRTELAKLRVAWRAHYGADRDPRLSEMIEDVALLARWVIDRYGIETTIGRVVK